jgi:hypothetical protein
VDPKKTISVDQAAAGETLPREDWIRLPLAVAEDPPRLQPVATWAELARELDADREDR